MALLTACYLSLSRACGNSRQRMPARPKPPTRNRPRNPSPSRKRTTSSSSNIAGRPKPPPCPNSSSDSGPAMAQAKAELIAGAEERKDLPRRSTASSTPIRFVDRHYETAGQSPRLLSLSIRMLVSFTGGAHGNCGTDSFALGPSRRRRRSRSPMYLAEEANRDRLLAQRWCDALNKARRGEARRRRSSGRRHVRRMPAARRSRHRSDRWRQGRQLRSNSASPPRPMSPAPMSRANYDIELRGRRHDMAAPRARISCQLRGSAGNSRAVATGWPAARRRHTLSASI